VAPLSPSFGLGDNNIEWRWWYEPEKDGEIRRERRPKYFSLVVSRE